MDIIDKNDIIKEYNSISEIWPASDKWHTYTYLCIKAFIKECDQSINLINLKIINAGSAGNNYELPEAMTLHVDIADQKFSTYQKYLVASIEAIPVIDSEFDVVICVGSVINYCDPLKVINEFKRVLKPNGYLILEFENSSTLELMFKNTFNRKVVLIESFYQGYKEKLWYFSETFVHGILKHNGFKIMKIKRFHILSPLLYRITKDQAISSKFAKFDILFRWIPGLRKLSSNVILMAQVNNC